jgi:hypothetical protein
MGGSMPLNEWSDWTRIGQTVRREALRVASHYFAQMADEQFRDAQRDLAMGDSESPRGPHAVKIAEPGMTRNLEGAA